MSTTLIVILITVGLVAFFVLAMSLTLMIKGHNIKSEISDNEHMQARGIKCAIQEDREIHSPNCADTSCLAGNCATCSTDTTK